MARTLDVDSFAEGVYASIDFEKGLLSTERIHWEFEKFRHELLRARHDGYSFGYEHGYAAGLKDGESDG